MAITLRRKANFSECVRFNHMRMHSAAAKAVRELEHNSPDYIEVAACWGRELIDKGYAFGKDGLYVVIGSPADTKSSQGDVKP